MKWFKQNQVKNFQQKHPIKKQTAWCSNHGKNARRRGLTWCTDVALEFVGHRVVGFKLNRTSEVAKFQRTLGRQKNVGTCTLKCQTLGRYWLFDRPPRCTAPLKINEQLNHISDRIQKIFSSILLIIRSIQPNIWYNRWKLHSRDNFQFTIRTVNYAVSPLNFNALPHSSEIDLIINRQWFIRNN